MEREGKERRESMGEEEWVLKERKRKGKEPLVEASVEEGSYIGELGRIRKGEGMVVQWGKTKKRSPGFSREIDGARAAEIIIALHEGTLGPPPTGLVRLLSEGQIARLSGPFEKKLTNSDIHNGLARLLIPGIEVATYIRPVFGEAVGAKFMFHDGEDREYELNYSKWKIGNVFNGMWTKFMKDNKLKEDDSVKIWVFEYSTSRRFGGIILPIKKPR